MTITNQYENILRVKLTKAKIVAWEYLGERNVSTVRVLGLGGLFINTPTPRLPVIT